MLGVFPWEHLLSTSYVPGPGLLLGPREHKPQAQRQVQAQEPQPAHSPLTSQLGASSPRASGGSSTLPAHPPGPSGSRHLGLLGGGSHIGGIWERLEKAGPQAPLPGPRKEHCWEAGTGL